MSNFAGLLDGAVNINADRLRQLDEHLAAIKECLRDDDDLSSVLRSFLPRPESFTGVTGLVP